MSSVHLWNDYYELALMHFYIFFFLIEFYRIPLIELLQIYSAWVWIIDKLRSRLQPLPQALLTRKDAK